MSRSLLDPIPLLATTMTLMIAVIVAAGIAGVTVVDIIRSYGNGTAHYSKGHLTAVGALTRLARTGDPKDFDEYRRRIHPTLSDGVAREILDEEDLPVSNSYPFLIQGNNHPDDVAGIAWLYRTFRDTPLFAPARDTWVRADEKIRQIDTLAYRLLHLSEAEPGNAEGRRFLMRQIDRISDEVGNLEDTFMLQMGRSARVLKTTLFTGLGGLGFLLAVLIWGLGLASRRRLANADRLIRDRERRLEDIVEVAADWVWETDADHRFTFISSRLEEIVDVSTKVFLGQRRRQNAAREDAVRWQRHEEDLAKHRAFRDFEYVFRHPKGGERHFRINGKPVLDERGTFLGYRGTGSDITDEVEARREARLKQELLETTFHHMAQGISVVDSNLTAVAFNRRFLELLEFPPDRFRQGDPFEAFVRYNAERGEYGPGDVETLVAERVAQAARFEPHDFERARPDGTVIEICGRPLPAGGFVTTYTDVTERNRAIDELRSAKTLAEAANQAKTMFLANMSHELRTPLNAVIGFSGLLAECRFGPLSDRYMEYARDINESGQHLLSVINDILDLSKIDIGQVDARPVPTPSRAITDVCFRLLQDRATAADVSLVNDIPEDAPTIYADERLFRQILLNLVGNAVKFSEAGGTVVVRYVAEEAVTGVAVSDQGLGMRRDQIARALEPFVQLDSGYARVHEGAGLGLSLVQRYMELHQGRLTIDSEPNCGTTVTVLFPVQPS